MQSTTPGRVFEDLLILGSATNQGYGSAPGDIRAFDVRTGKLVWTFHTIPHPGEFGYDTWPKDAWKTVGGANVWGEMSLDEKRGILYAPTASAKYNFYGADRTGANLFGDCLLALDARTGKRLWHFQMVHHDIWDYDDATAPETADRAPRRQDGRRGGAGQQAGLRLGLRSRDRQAAVAHRRAPVPASRHARREDVADAAVPDEAAAVRAPEVHGGRSESVPQSAGPRAISRRDSQRAQRRAVHAARDSAAPIQMPGNNGGANWGGAAVDPAHGILVVVSKDLPSLLKLESKTKRGAESADARYDSGFGFMIASDGLAAIAPPWTSLTAYDLNEGTIQWKIPLGEVPELAAKGIKNTGTHYPKVGPVVTAGGLIFTGTRDRKVRAFDVETGKVLWEKEARRGARRDSRGLRNRRQTVHRVLRRRAGGLDAGRLKSRSRARMSRSRCLRGSSAAWISCDVYSWDAGAVHHRSRGLSVHDRRGLRVFGFPLDL